MLGICILLGIAILPVFLIGKYVYKKDVDKEPIKMVRRVFILGCISVIPALVFEMTFEHYFPSKYMVTDFEIFLSVFIGIALIEEFCKWFMVMFSVYQDKEYNDFYDGIVYCVFSALGFACIENILYVFKFGIGTGLLRAVLSVPSHVCDGIIMGYFLSCAKRESKKSKILESIYIVCSVIFPFLIHGMYDYFITIGDTSSVAAFFILVVLIYIICIYLISKVSKNDVRII